MHANAFKTLHLEREHKTGLGSLYERSHKQ